MCFSSDTFSRGLLRLRRLARDESISVGSSFSVFATFCQLSTCSPNKSTRYCHSEYKSAGSYRKNPERKHGFQLRNFKPKTESGHFEKFTKFLTERYMLKESFHF